MSELKACPFCGGDDLAVTKDVDFLCMYVRCLDCCCEGRKSNPIGWCESEREATEAWNTRPNDEKRIKQTYTKGWNDCAYKNGYQKQEEYLKRMEKNNG